MLPRLFFFIFFYSLHSVFETEIDWISGINLSLDQQKDYLKKIFIAKKKKPLFFEISIDDCGLDIREDYYRQIIQDEEFEDFLVLCNIYEDLKNALIPRVIDNKVEDLEFLRFNLEQLSENFRRLFVYHLLSNDFNLFLNFVNKIKANLFLINMAKIKKASPFYHLDSLDKLFHSNSFLSSNFDSNGLITLAFENFNVYIYCDLACQKIEGLRMSLHVKRVKVINKNGKKISSIFSEMPLKLYLFFSEDVSGHLISNATKVELCLLLGSCLSFSIDKICMNNIEQFLVYSFLIDIESKFYSISLNLENYFDSKNFLFSNEFFKPNFHSENNYSLSKNLWYYGCSDSDIKKFLLISLYIKKFYEDKIKFIEIKSAFIYEYEKKQAIDNDIDDTSFSKDCLQVKNKSFSLPSVSYNDSLWERNSCNDNNLMFYYFPNLGDSSLSIFSDSVRSYEKKNKQSSKCNLSCSVM